MRFRSAGLWLVADSGNWLVAGEWGMDDGQLEAFLAD